MRFHYLAVTAALCMAAVTGRPVYRRRTPVENSPLAHLEGLSACYAKCMISEAHLWKYDMFTWSLDDWCADYYGRWGHTAIWITQHFKPCVKNNCPRSDFNSRKSGEWFDRHCPK